MSNNMEAKGKGEVLLTGRMSYTPEYFHKAAASYADWRSAWWREALQNSVDAGATEIELKSAMSFGDHEGAYVLSVTDNGSGMSQDTLVDRFLAFGGSQKASDAVGGFGKAKELLILPWVCWSMASRDLHAHGVAMDWTLERATDTGHTKLEVVMAGPSDRQTHCWAARGVLRRSHLPGVRVTVQEGSSEPETVQGVEVGEFIREFSFGKLYLCNATALESFLLVRVKGLFMHSQYLFTSLPAGKTLVLEVSTPSTETFTDNRDALLPSFKKELDKFVQEYSVDQRSALKDQSKLERFKFKGTGSFRARRLEERAEEVASRMTSTMTVREKYLPLDTKQVDTLVGMLSDMVQELENEAGGEKSREFQKFQRFSEATARAALETIDTVAGSIDIESLLKRLVWEPDFLCVSKIPGYRIPAEMLPETMSPRVTKISLVWTELCRYILAILKCDKEFGVGFVFSDEGSFSAQYERHEDGSHWLLFNPFKDHAKKTMVAPTTEEDLAQMFASALHECTHLASGIMRHDQEFAEALTNNVALCSRGWRKIKQIEKGAKMTKKVEMASLKNG